MSNSILFARLNDLRIANNMPALKSNKMSVAALNAAIDKLTPVVVVSPVTAVRVSPVAEYARAHNMSPKTVRALLRRHNVARDASAIAFLDTKYSPVA